MILTILDYQLSHRFEAPNAVNADEAALRERKEKEKEDARLAAEEAKRVAEEKRIDDLLGPPTESEDELSTNRKSNLSGAVKSSKESSAAFDHDAMALAAGLQSLEDNEKMTINETNLNLDEGGGHVNSSEIVLFDYET